MKPCADALLGVFLVLGLRLMELGCDVIYKGKRYVLRGWEPMSVPDRRAEVEDPESGELLSVPVDLLEAVPERRGLNAEA